MDVNLSEAWHQLPFVTRHAGLATIACLALMVVSPQTSLLLWRGPNAPWWQVWRFLTAPFCQYSGTLGAIVNAYYFIIGVNELETTVFTNRGRLLYYLAFLSVGFGLLGPYFGMYHFLNGMSGAIIWTLAQENPHVTMMIAYVIPISRRYYPLANIALSVIVAQSIEAAYLTLLGIFLAHLFMYLTELLPQAGGVRWFASTPKIFKVFDDYEQRRENRKQFGSGHRLDSSQRRWL